MWAFCVLLKLTRQFVTHGSFTDEKSKINERKAFYFLSAQEFVEILNGTRNKILLIIRCGVARPLLKFICLFKELMRSLKNYF